MKRLIYSLVLALVAFFAFCTLPEAIVIAQETVDHSTAQGSRPWAVRPNFPGVCKPGEMITRSDKTWGQNVYMCDSANTFQPVTGPAGTITSAFVKTGTSSNTDTAGQITLATGAGTYTFAGTYATAPICVATDATAAAAVKATVSTTTITFAGTGSDVINYACFART